MTKYRKIGTHLNRNKGNFGRSQSSVTDEIIKKIRQLLKNNQHLNSRRNGLVLSPSSFNQIVRKEIRWHPHQIYVRQQLH